LPVKDLLSDDQILDRTLRQSSKQNSDVALSLIVPTHRRANKLKTLLRSLSHQDFPRDQYEIFVVSNFIDPEARGVAELFKKDLPRLHYVELGQKGVNASRNHGLDLANGDVIYFLDDDCELVAPHHLKTVVELHADFPDATAIGGSYLLPEGSSLAAQAYHWASSRWISPPLSKWKESWRLVGGNVSYKKSRLRAAGVQFDPGIIFGGSETEMHLRLEAAQHQGVLHSDIFLRHRCEIGLKDLISKGFRQGRTAGRFSSADLFSFKGLDTSCSNASVGETFPRVWVVAIYHFLYQSAFGWGFDFGSAFHGSKALASAKSPLSSPAFVTALLKFGRARIHRIPIKTPKPKILLCSRVISRAGWAVYNFIRWNIVNFIRWNIVGFLWWRIASPGLGLVRLFYRLSPEPVHGGRGSLRLMGKFILFSLQKLNLRGSKTSSFMHREWRARVTHDKTPGVFIPLPQSKAKILRLAATSRRFDFQKLVFKEDFLKRGDSIEISRELITNDFEIVIFYQDHGLEKNIHETICELRRLGCRLIPNLTIDGSADGYPVFNEGRELAIGPDTDLKVLVKFAENRQSRGGSESPRLIYVDFFPDHSFNARKTYALTNEFLIHPVLKNLTWETLDLFQPFGAHPISPRRFLEGELVSKFGDDSVNEAAVKWSIIIPCYENFSYLLPVLHRIFEQDYERSEMEIVLVDDGSTNHLSDYLKPHLEKNPPPCALKIIRIERKDSRTPSFDSTFRAGLARNAGVIHSRGEHLLFLDSDILVSRVHLRDLDASFETADVVQNIRRMLTAKASRIENIDGDTSNINLREDTYSEDYYWESFKKTSDWNQLSAPWKYVCTYSLALKRKTLERIKPFRPEFCEYGFEDTELGFRLFKVGLRFHLSQRPVFHLYPIASGDLRSHDSWSVHFDERTRFQTISRSAQLFYRMHRDPSIFFELRSLLDPP
jgi:glycosyltransferase involved in cell wall biosynthesis